MKEASRKRVGIFARALTQGGVTRFLENVLSDFNTDTETDYILFTDDPKIQKKYPNITCIEVQSKHKIIWDYWAAFKAAHKQNLDVTLYTKNIIPLSHLFLNTKKIIFAYDLGYFDKRLKAYPFIDTLYMRLFFGMSVKIADTILAISEYTKHDLIKILHAKPEKIKVILLAADKNYTPCTDQEKITAVCKKYDIQKPFLFYCGNLSQRKNIPRIVESIVKIKDDIPHNFYIGGPKTLGSENTLKIAEKNLGNRYKHLGFIDEEDMPVLYSAADVYLFPSLYEGFGLPILEANASGCPVLTSNLTSCPEIAGDAAHIVDAHSITSIADGIKKIVLEPNYKKNLIKNGFRNAKKFHWETTMSIIKKNIKN